MEPGALPSRAATAGGPFVLWVALVAFALAAVFINPLRETAMDDDWAYALTVRHLLDTGHYQLHDWAAANMPFQIYWGALFSKVLGFSQATLRLSTLAVVVLGLVAFYFLAREHELSGPQAGVAVLGLIASPLVLRFSFNFMTDVPLVMWLVVALLFYTRALRLRSYGWVLLGSVAASVAILTRQFGIALIAGLGAVWLVSRDKKANFPLVVAGVILPCVAAGWQFAAGRQFPNWTADLRMQNLKDYWADVPFVAENTLWRGTVVLHFLALFTLPLVFWLVPTFLASFAVGDRRPTPMGFRSLAWNVVLLGLFAAGIFAGVLFGKAAKDKAGTDAGIVGRAEDDQTPGGRSKVGSTMPYRTMPYAGWNFDKTLSNENLAIGDGKGEVKRNGEMVRRALTLLTAFGAVLLGAAFVRRYLPLAGWCELTPGERLLDLVTLFLLGLHMVYAQFGDEYLLVFLPYTLIVIVRQLGGWLRPLFAPVVLGCLAMFAVSAVWTRGLLAEEEAQWSAAEAVRARGIEPAKIFGSWEWNCYQGAFDDYLKNIHREKVFGKLDDGYDGLKDFFVRYQGERAKGAKYFIAARDPGEAVPEGMRVVAEFPYRDMLWREKVARAEMATDE